MEQFTPDNDTTTIEEKMKELTEDVSVDETPAVEIVFNLPTKKTPGYLRRMREAAEVRARAKVGDFEAINCLVNYLAQFVANATTREDAINLLLDASEEQLEQAFAFLNGENPTK